MDKACARCRVAHCSKVRRRASSRPSLKKPVERSGDYARAAGSRRHDRRHSLSLHRGSFLNLAELFKSGEHLEHHPAAFIDVGKLATAKQHVHQDFVLRLEEFLGTLDLDLDIVIAGLGPHPDFLDVNLVLLLFGELLLLGVLEFAVIDDLADRRALVGSDLNQVKTRLARSLKGLTRRHHAKHRTFGVDNPHR